MNIDFWALLGKLALLATVATAFSKFVLWRRAPREKLVARISPDLFTLPPSVESEFAAAADNVHKALTKFFAEYPEKKEGYDEAYRRSDLLAMAYHPTPTPTPFRHADHGGGVFPQLQGRGE